MGLFKKIFHRKGKADEDDYEYEDEDTEIEDVDQSYGVADSTKNVYIPVSKNKAASKSIGEPTQLETISPSSIAIDDDSNPDTVCINESGNMREFAQPYYIPASGYAYQVDLDTFRSVLSHGWVDCSIDIYPQDNAIARRDLKRTQTIIEGNLLYQEEKGMQFQLRDNIIKSQSIEYILAGIQRQINSVYYITVTFLIYGNNANDLRRHCDQFTSEMANTGFTVQKLSSRVKSGFLDTIPLGIQLTTLDDAMRLIDCHALAKFDFAQNEAGRFNEGIPYAINLQNAQRNMEYLNIFGTEEHSPDNYNFGYVGESGSGKSFANKIKIYREIMLSDYHIRTIDPNREYVKLAHRIGHKNALNLDFSPDSSLIINPCRLTIAEKPTNVVEDYDNNSEYDADIGELRQLITDQKLSDNQIVTHDGEHFIRYVPIDSKINQIIDFVKQIYAADYDNKYVMTPEEKQILSHSIRKVFDNLGITSNPDSLYTGTPGDYNGRIVTNVPKPEPTLSDIEQVIRKDYFDGKEDTSPATRLLSVISPYLRTGTIPIFDGQTFFGYGQKNDLGDYRYVNFNISELQGSFKQVAAYVIAQINWSNWIVNPRYATQKKVLVIDEILQLIKNPIFGDFVELAIRQARKFNASITWLAQDLGQIKKSDQFRALISNSNFFYFTHIKESERKMIQELFNLNDGVMDKLCSPIKPGEGILVDNEQQLWTKIWVMPSDMEYAESNVAKARQDLEDSIRSRNEFNEAIRHDRRESHLDDL